MYLVKTAAAVPERGGGGPQRVQGQPAPHLTACTARFPESDRAGRAGGWASRNQFLSMLPFS